MLSVGIQRVPLSVIGSQWSDIGIEAVGVRGIAEHKGARREGKRAALRHSIMNPGPNCSHAYAELGYMRRDMAIISSH